MRISDWSSDVCSSDLRGDTLLELIMGEGFERNDAHAAIDALRPVYDPRRLRIGQAVTLTYVADGDVRSLVGLRLAKSYDREAVVGRIVEGGFEAYESEKQHDLAEIGRAHVRTPVTKAHLVCRILHAKTKTKHNT